MVIYEKDTSTGMLGLIRICIAVVLGMPITKWIGTIYFLQSLLHVLKVVVYVDVDPPIRGFGNMSPCLCVQQVEPSQYETRYFNLIYDTGFNFLTRHL